MANIKELPANITVLSGSHTDCDPSNGASGCVMNLVAWACGYEEITDTPPCASPVLTRYAIRLNDSIADDELRTTLLLPIVPLLAGSKSTPEVESKRMFFLVDKAVRVFAPIALDAMHLHAHAATLRALPEVIDKMTAAAYAAAARAADAAAYAAAAARAARAADAAAYAAAAAAYAAAARAADAADAAADAAYAADAADAAVYTLAADVLRQACEIVS